MMPDREKVVKGLEGMIDYFFDIYRNDTDSYKCAKAQEYSDCAIDALALLKEQEMRECCLCKHYDSVYKHCTYHDHDVEESEYCSRWVKYDA